MIPQVLIPRFYKWIGLALYLSVLVYLFIEDTQSGVNFRDFQNPVSFWVQFLAFIGLFMMLSARLKHEDERTTQLRLNSFQWGTVLFILNQLKSLALCYYYETAVYLPKSGINLMLLICIIIFYFQAYCLPWIQAKLSKSEE